MMCFELWHGNGFMGTGIIGIQNKGFCFWGEGKIITFVRELVKRHRDLARLVLLARC